MNAGEQEKVADAAGKNRISYGIFYDVFAVSLFAALIAFLNRHTTDNYWLFEELQFVKQAFQYHPWQYFFDPRVWRDVSMQSLMPWLTLSFDVDLSLFGWHAGAFYIHHLISVWVAAVMFYVVLRLWVRRPAALAGVLFFLVSAPVAAVSEMLMVRHYIEGAALALSSLYLYVTALRRDSPVRAVLSAVLYLMAASAKEVYVPLIVIVLFLPEGGWKKRVKSALPLLVAAVFYVGWRFWMLGTPVGGYNGTMFTQRFSLAFMKGLASNLAVSLRMLWAGTWGATIILPVVLALLLAALLRLIFSRKYRELTFSAVLLCMAYFPLLPVMNTFSPGEFISYRLVYSVSLVFAAVLALSLEYGFRRGVASGKSAGGFRRAAVYHAPELLIFLIIGLSLWNTNQWMTFQRRTLLKPLTAEGHFLMDHGKGVLMEKSHVVPANNFYKNLSFFKRIYRHGPIPGVVRGYFAYPDDVSGSKLRNVRIYEYDQRAGRMEDITAEFLKKRAAFISRIRSLPLSVSLGVHRGVFNFSLGPSAQGEYFVLLGYESGLYCFSGPVPRRMRRRAFTGLKTYIRFGWKSPGGLMTLSPEWLLDFSGDKTISWRRF